MAAQSWPAPALARPITSQQPALRAKSLGRLRLPARQAAREFGAAALEAAASNASNGELGRHLGGDMAGAQARTGALVLTTAEVALLLPVDVALGTLAECLRERVVRESSEIDPAHPDQLKFRMALMHLESLGALLRR